VCFLRLLCFVRLLQYRYLPVFPLSHWRVPLPQIDWPTTQQYPSSRVCFHRNSALVVGCVFTESLLCFPSHGSNGPPPRQNSTSTYMYHPSLISFSHHSTMTSRSGDENGFGPELWQQQSPDFVANFPLKGKSDFTSMREVRSYAPKQSVLWPRCSHGELCVMQVYEGWNNSGRRFWHCPYAWVSNVDKFVHHVSLVR
jgi:hypothetical protein